MLPSDPSPKATSFPPTAVPEIKPAPSFNVGDVVTLVNGRPGNTARVLEASTDNSIVKIHNDTSGDVWVPKCDIALVAPAPPTNNVDHPSHYTAGGIETIVAIEAMVGQKGWNPLTGYRLGNVLKYLWRHAAKGGVESLKKARWYLDREIEQQEAEKTP